MIRPAKITLIGLALTWGTVADAEGDAMARLRKQYEECVYAATGDQWKTSPKINPAVAAETAFLACTTEEQAIYGRLALLGVAPVEAQAAVVGVKLRLKSKIREIMIDPKGYMQRSR